MNSPIARGLVAAAHLLEWCHRRIHGPKFAPGDVVETPDGNRTVVETDGRGEVWARDASGKPWNHRDIRVVRYAGGE